MDELLLRIQALHRRAKIATSHRLEVGKLVLDADERTAYLDGEEIPLTVREFNLIYKLLSYPLPVPSLWMNFGTAHLPPAPERWTCI